VNLRIQIQCNKQILVFTSESWWTVDESVGTMLKSESADVRTSQQS